MVSGSSDCHVFVWDLISLLDGKESREGKEMKHRAVLSGHAGGVLDLRIDEKWVVSWYVVVVFPSTVFLTLTIFVSARRIRSSASGLAKPWSYTVLSLDTKVP